MLALCAYACDKLRGERENMKTSPHSAPLRDFVTSRTIFTHQTPGLFPPSRAIIIAGLRPRPDNPGKKTECSMNMIE